MDKKIKVINRNTKSASPSSEKSSSNNIIKNFANCTKGSITSTDCKESIQPNILKNLENTFKNCNIKSFN